jgi:hypothetical protein
MARLDRAIHALLYLTMCSIILRLTPEGTYLAANRDELIRRAWDPPAPHWPDHPGIIAGRDNTAGGTWMGLNEHGVMAAILNRHGSLGPAPGKLSRGELPLLALKYSTAAEAAASPPRSSTPRWMRNFIWPRSMFYLPGSLVFESRHGPA